MLEDSLKPKDFMTSRFIVERALLEPRLSRLTGAALNVINVFCVSGERIAPLPLRVLYLLRAWHAHAPMSNTVIESLLRHGYSKPEISVVLSNMLSVSRRLIFSGISDQFEGVDVWQDKPRPVHLASSGLGYLEKLVVTPAYLQWALNQNAAVKAAVEQKGLTLATAPDNMHTRLRYTLLGLEACMDDEWARSEKVWQECDGDACLVRNLELPCLCPAGDVFFKSMHSFFAAIRVQQGKTTADRTMNKAVKSKAIIALGHEWLDVAKDAMDRHREVCEIAPANWETAYDFAKEDLTKLTERHNNVFPALRLVP